MEIEKKKHLSGPIWSSIVSSFNSFSSEKKKSNERKKGEIQLEQLRRQIKDKEMRWQSKQRRQDSVIWRERKDRD